MTTFVRVSSKVLALIKMRQPCDRVSVIVIDLKYPDTVSGFFDMVPLFVKAGHDVQLFLPYGEHTLRLPLLLGTETFQGASEVADMIAPDVKHEAASFYRKQERLLLTALLMGMAREGQPSLGVLFRLLRQGRTAVQSYIHKHSDPLVRETAKGFFDLDAGKQAGVIAGLAGELQAFDDPRLERATTASNNPKENLDLEGVGLRPTLLYIGIPQEHLQGTRATVLLKLLKRAIDLSLLKAANAHSGKLPNHVSFYLDEFANLGVLPNVGETFATMRSRRVAYHVSLQNRAQGEALYGRDQFKSFITNNFQQVIIFPRSLKFEDADYFSRALGFITALDRSEGSSSEGFLGKRRRSELLREVARPLLSIEEMMDWPEAMGVLLASGAPPVKVILPRLDEAKVLGVKNPLHKRYRDALDVPAPHLLAQILIQRRVGESLQAVASQSEESPTFRATDGHTIKPIDIIPRGVESESKPPGRTLVEIEGNREGKQPAVGHEKKLEVLHFDPQQALLAWLDDLAVHDVGMKQFRNPRSNALSKVNFDLSTIPTPLQKPDGLDAWITNGWVKVSSQEIGLVGKGLEVVGKKRLQQLQRMVEQNDVKAEAKQVEAESPAVAIVATSELEVLRQKETEKLRRYLNENGHLLKGHPQRKAKTALEAIGTYQDGTVILERNLVERLLQRPLPEDLSMNEALSEQGARLEISLCRLQQLEPLNAWFEENQHRLEGHMSYEALAAKGEAPPVVGLFRPEVVALPKKVLKNLLGSVPAYGKEVRPIIDGKRPYLIGIELSPPEQ